MKQRIILALVAVIGGMFLVAPPASAHTPSITATCEGIVLKATAYDGGKDNTWTVTVGGATSSGTFGSSFSRTFPVAQGGASTEWSATIKGWNGEYAQSKSGTVGPCGTKPVPVKPKDKVVVTEAEKVKCEEKVVVKTITTTTTPFVLNEAGDAYVEGTPVVTTKDETRPATETECPPVMVPPTDACPDLPGDQPKGTDCTPEPPTEEPPVVEPPAPQPPVTDNPPIKEAPPVATPPKVDTPKVDTPVIDTPSKTTGDEPVLPSAGGPSKMILVAGVALVLVGAYVLFMRRRRSL